MEGGARLGRQQQEAGGGSPASCTSTCGPPLSQDDIWLEVSRVRSSLGAASHPSPDCRGLLHQLDTAGTWSKWLLVLLDGVLYIYSEVDPESPARGQFPEYHKTSQSLQESFHIILNFFSVQKLLIVSRKFPDFP